MQQKRISSLWTNKEIMQQTTLYSQYKAPSVFDAWVSPTQIHIMYTQTGRKDKKETKFQYNFLKHHSNVTISFGLDSENFKLMRWRKLRFANCVWRFALIRSVCLCLYACIVFIQSAKGFSALSCVLFVTALPNIIILSIIKNNENTNSASGYFTFHLIVFTAVRDQETRTRPVLVVWLYLHFMYCTRFVLIKTWTFYVWVI